MRRYPKCTVVLVCLFVVCLGVQAGEPEPLYVGDSGVCTYGSLQAAIDDASSGDEIRVSNEFFMEDTLLENISIDKDLTIKGGYSTCGLAQLDSRLDTNRTIIDGTESGNVIKVDGDHLSVHVSGFTLTGGVSEGVTPFAPRGGGVSVRGNGNEVTFEHMTILDNNGRLGGGIYVSGNSHEIALIDTLVMGNTAFSGGGIHCASGDAVKTSITLRYDQLSVIDNQATGGSESAGYGGGIYLSRCIFAPIGFGASQSKILIAQNNANNSGGGVFAENTGQVWLNGQIWSNAANVDANDTGDGGGVFADSVSQLFTGDVSFIDNQVTNGNGGALMLLDSRIVISTTVFDSCTQSGSEACLFFDNNRAISGGGGALYFDDSHLLTGNLNDKDSFLGYVFNENRADFGSVLAMSGNSWFSMQNGLNTNNGGDGLGDTLDTSAFFLNDEDVELVIGFSTFVNNDVASVFNAQSGASLNLFGSIIYEQETENLVLVNNLASVDTRCNVYHEGESVSILPADPSVVTDNPGFVDPDIGNYHLRADSVAIDRCNDGGFDVIYPDLDQDARPIDVPGVNHAGPGSYDAGADEYNDVIFQNGFELKSVAQLH